MSIQPILYAAMVLGGLGVLFGVVLTVSDKVFGLEVDERSQAIRTALPGANCGACGYPGCDGFAAAIVRGEARPNGCIPGGKKTAEAIAEIMGTETGDIDVPRAARVVCQGETGVAEKRYEYVGHKSCQVASTMAGGPKVCRYACIGLGDCVAVCKFDALRIENGIARVDEKKCTACGMCQKACPRECIQLLPMLERVIVKCRNEDSPRAAMEACKKACISCKRCEKACEFDAIEVRDGFAHIDGEKCTSCGACQKVCPTGCIVIKA